MPGFKLQKSITMDFAAVFVDDSSVTVYSSDRLLQKTTSFPKKSTSFMNKTTRLQKKSTSFKKKTPSLQDKMKNFRSRKFGQGKVTKWNLRMKKVTKKTSKTIVKQLNPKKLWQINNFILKRSIEDSMSVPVNLKSILKQKTSEETAAHSDRRVVFDSHIKTRRYRIPNGHKFRSLKAYKIKSDIKKAMKRFSRIEKRRRYFRMLNIPESIIKDYTVQKAPSHVMKRRVVFDMTQNSTLTYLIPEGHKFIPYY